MRSIPALLVLALASPCAADVTALIEEPRWQLFAVEYARAEDVPARRLLEGAPASARTDMSFLFFVVVGHGRVVLVDSGTDALARSDAMRRRWRVVRAIDVRAALALLGLAPAQVTDVVITHHHWDHVGGLPRFARATVYAEQSEWARVPAQIRRPIEQSGRLRTWTGARELWPGFTVRDAGRHTAHHAMIELACADRRVVIAGDAAYLYRNVEEPRAVAVATSPSANLADVARAVREVGRANVIPGHDAAIFTRHPSDAPGVASICR